MKLFNKLSLLILAAAISASALAQEMGPNNQKLADRWTAHTEKWLATENVIEPLEDRLAGEEVLYNGDLVDESVAAQIVAADESMRDGLVSEHVNQKLFTALKRQMKSKYLVSLIRTGKIEPRSHDVNNIQTSLKGVYLEFQRASAKRAFDEGYDTELQFDYAVLDRTDYLINDWWDFGQFGPLSASPLVENGKGRVLFYVESHLAQKERNEVVFFNALDFSSVKKIIVKSAALRADLLKQIRAEKLTCPRAGGCDALIVAD